MADNDNATLTEEQKAAITVEVENRIRPEIEAKLQGEFTEKINLARAEEKNKLYPEISKLKEDVKKKDASIAELTTQLADCNVKLADADKQVTELKAKVGDETATNAKIKELEERLAKVGEGAENSMSAEAIKAMEEKIAKLEKRDEERELELAKITAEKEIGGYRANKIKDLDESVQDLVSGSTKEEIDASYDKAKAAYDKLTNKFGANINSLPKVPSKMLNNPDLMKSTNQGDLASTSDTEWKELRKKFGFK